MSRNPLKSVLIGVTLIGVASFSYFILPGILSSEYVANGESSLGNLEELFNKDEPKKDNFIATHVKIPKDGVRTIYMTQCVAGTKSLRDKLVKLVEETEINSIIIDVKDYSGKLSFRSDHPELDEMLSDRCYVSDMKEFIEELHNKGIYVIARITVFQDPYYASLNPSIAVQKESDKSVWEDYKGLNFIDPLSKEFWDHIITISKESHRIGFDELNFDYVRFPSDGNMRDIYFPLSEGRVIADVDLGKALVIKDFFAYLHSQLKESGVILSADLFGMVTTNSDDLNIGQVLEYAEPYFDYIAPMVYPSHYPNGFNGWENPNDHVYEIIKYSMDKGVEKLVNIGADPLKLRPWLQDFDYGGDYDVKEVRAQIQATYDAGLTSWMLWSPSNVYTRGALEDSN